MARMSLELEGFTEMINKLVALEGDTKAMTDKMLRKTHEIVTKKAEEGMSHSHLPAKGHYSQGRTIKSLVRDARIEWQGDTASVSVGFDIDNGGLVSIFLMYGTPRYKKDTALYNAFYGKATREEIIAAQEEIFFEEIRRLEG